MDRLKLIMVMLIMVLAAALTASAQLSKDEPQQRTWNSHDGNESIEAAFESFDKRTKTVVLRNRFDETFDVKLALLSRRDQRYVVRINRENKNAAENKDARQEKSVFKKKQEQTRKPSAPTGRTVRRYGIDWTPGLDATFAKADTEGDRRPVMWFRVLGDLDGLM